MLRLEKNTGSTALNLIQAIGEALPARASADAAARSAEEIAQALRHDILARRFINQAERALRSRGLPPLTEDEIQQLAEIGESAFQGGLAGKSVKQAVSDALNNNGFSTLLGDQSSDDLESIRQPMFDASEPGDPHPSAADNLSVGSEQKDNQPRRSDRFADPLFLPRQRPRKDAPNRILRPPDDGLREPLALPRSPNPTPKHSPSISQPPDDGFREPVILPERPSRFPRRAPAIPQPPDDGFRDPLGPIDPPEPLNLLVASAPKASRRLAGTASDGASSFFGSLNTGFGR
ncbi:hypothetical protein [Ferruginivarius sediminum]|uniref:hypothetical protein n=1 Tax=Ferruginivarius sediminum TaxID=2661937 RepID=UPI0011C0539F|nr:hypothetical protein [Ferruginivarius sediminum]